MPRFLQGCPDLCIRSALHSSRFSENGREGGEPTATATAAAAAAADGGRRRTFLCRQTNTKEFVPQLKCRSDDGISIHE